MACLKIREQYGDKNYFKVLELPDGDPVIEDLIKKAQTKKVVETTIPPGGHEFFVSVDDVDAVIFYGNIVIINDQQHGIDTKKVWDHLCSLTERLPKKDLERELKRFLEELMERDRIATE